MMPQERLKEQHSLFKAYMDATQGHIFRFWDELNPLQRQRLLTQARALYQPMLQVQALYREYKAKEREQRSHLSCRFVPPRVIPLSQSEEELARAERARKEGGRSLREGKVACLMVAGGQSSRLGQPCPKGVIPVTPVSQKSLFHLHAEKILALSHRFGLSIPWYIMTSKSNHEETVTFFEQNAFFGLRAEDVFFFTQAMLPTLDLEGKLILDEKDHIFESPDGHGGVLRALKKSGALDQMRARGIEHLFSFQVDNPLVKMADPIFMGYHLMEGADMSTKVVAKKDPKEKVGLVGLIDGRLGVIEYSELPEGEKEAILPDGTLKFKAGNTAIHLLRVGFVEKMVEEGYGLPFHAALKEIPYIDHEGRKVEPHEPNGIKFETFLFDALPFARRSVCMEVRREEEFSPVKNQYGTDSLCTARRDISFFFARWLEEMGIELPRDVRGIPLCLIEISPLFACDKEELALKVSLLPLKVGRRLLLE